MGYLGNCVWGWTHARVIFYSFPRDVSEGWFKINATIILFFHKYKSVVVYDTLPKVRYPTHPPSYNLYSGSLYHGNVSQLIKDTICERFIFQCWGSQIHFFCGLWSGNRITPDLVLFMHITEFKLTKVYCPLMKVGPICSKRFWLYSTCACLSHALMIIHSFWVWQLYESGWHLKKIS